MTRSTSARTRPGFTLVEILVAAALCLIIMVAMTYAFQEGMGAFSHAKSLGDLQSRLRTAEVTLQTDLRAEHLEGDTGPMRVSDVFRLDAAGNITPPPPRGFFRVTQESGLNLNQLPLVATDSPKLIESFPYQYEGQDADGISSTRATDHVLHMTVRRRGTRAEELFFARVPNTNTAPPRNPWSIGTAFAASHSSALVPPGGEVYGSEWAEVVYFLDTSNSTGRTVTGLPTFSLIRRVRVLPDRPTGLDWANNTATSITGGPPALGRLPEYQGMSYVPLTATTTLGLLNPGELNDPATITNPRNRLGGMVGRRLWPRTPPTTLPPGNVGYELASTYGELAPTREASGALFGDDILLTNVLSLEIKAEWQTLPVQGVRNTDYVLWPSNHPADAWLPLPPSHVPPSEWPPPAGWSPPSGTSTAFPLGWYPPVPPANAPMDNSFTPRRNNEYPFADIWPALRNTELTAVHKIVPPNAPAPAQLAVQSVTRRVLDTWHASPAAMPANGWRAAGQSYSAPAIVRLRAIQIKVRVYDTKNHLTRQITVVQDL